MTNSGEGGGIMNGGGEGENEPTDAPVGRYGQYPQGGAGARINFICAIKIAIGLH